VPEKGAVGCGSNDGKDVDAERGEVEARGMDYVENHSGGGVNPSQTARTDMLPG